MWFKVVDMILLFCFFFSFSGCKDLTKRWKDLISMRGKKTKKKKESIQHFVFLSRPLFFFFTFTSSILQDLKLINRTKKFHFKNQYRCLEFFLKMLPKMYLILFYNKTLSLFQDQVWNCNIFHVNHFQSVFAMGHVQR